MFYKILLLNIDKIHTIKIRITRIQKNLKINTCDVIDYCKSKILDKKCKLYKQGKNSHCEIDNLRITINSSSYTIITAHIINL